MKLIRAVTRSANDGLYHRQFNRSLTNYNSDSVGLGNNDDQNANSDNIFDDFKKRLFGNNFKNASFYGTLDRIEKDRDGPSMGNPRGDSSGRFVFEDDTFTTLSDGMEGKLKRAATYFEVDPQETVQDNYTYRPDINLRPRMTYTPEDLNIRKPGVWKTTKRVEFEVTTKEALENADFRNVRFLANFLTEAGIIIKRSQTGISAKAQRKVAREIKIARAFGLLPFTTMGTKAFVYGKTMESLDQDFDLDPYDIQARAADVPDPVEE